MEIVQALPEDARSIREIQYKTWLKTYPNQEAGISIEDIENRFKNAFSDEEIKKREDKIRTQPFNKKIFIAKENNKVMGFCSVTEEEDHNQLDAIYVLPQFQGQGVGGLLWKEALKFLNSTKNTIVHVATYNSQAIKFYKKLGFEDTGKRFTDEKFKMKSGAVLPEMEMLRKANK